MNKLKKYRGCLQPVGMAIIGIICVSAETLASSVGGIAVLGAMTLAAGLCAGVTR